MRILSFLYISSEYFKIEQFKMRRGAQFKTQHSKFQILFVAHSGARTWCHALPWWALRCHYPRRPQQPENKKILRL